MKLCYGILSLGNKERGGVLFMLKAVRAAVFVMLFPLTSSLLPLTSLHAEDVRISAYYPSPYGNYRQVQVQDVNNVNPTGALTQAGINIITDYNVGAFTPGIFWSTPVNNPTLPKAGIWMQENANGSLLYFGTSNAYGTGITSNTVIDRNGNLGIGITAPIGPLHVVGASDVTSSVAFMPGADTVAVATVPNIRVGIGTTAPSGPLHVVGANDALSSVILAPGADTGAAGTPAIQLGIGTTTPNASAILDLTSTTQALLIPRMTTTQRGNITTPTDGMVIYNSTVPQFESVQGTVASSGFLGQQVGVQVVRVNDALTNGTDTHTIGLSGYSGATKVLLENLAEMKGDDGYTQIVYDFLNSSGTVLVSVMGAHFANITETRSSGIGTSQLVDIPTQAAQLRISLTISRDGDVTPYAAANGQAKATVTFYK